MGGLLRELDWMKRRRRDMKVRKYGGKGMRDGVWARQVVLKKIAYG